MLGTPFAVNGFGAVAPATFRGIKSLGERSTPVIGHWPVLEICLSITDYSKTCPDFKETTGLVKACPDRAQ